VRKQRQKARDPIFALIKDHNAKHAAVKKAEASLKRLGEKLDAKVDHGARAEKNPLSQVWPPLYLGHAYPINGPGKSVRQHVYVRLRDAGTAFGPKMQRKLLALQPFARKEIEQMFAAFQTEHKRKREAAGLTALHKQWMAALEVWGKARRRMVATAPRTPQGAAALAEELVAFEYHCGDLDVGLETLARAVAMAARGDKLAKRKATKPSAALRR
jgi:hypothetical protein